MLMLQRPEITQEELGKNRTQFVIEPLAARKYEAPGVKLVNPSTSPDE